jgi:replicative DNA helicase
MEQFNEYEFIWSLTIRPEDARIFSQIFQPDWLKDPALKAILSEVYKFTKDYGTPPALTVLDKIFFAEDAVMYNSRYKPALDKVRAVNLAVSEQIYLLTQAKNVAISRSLELMMQDMDFQTKLTGHDGKALLKDINTWLQHFTIAEGETSSDLIQAWERLVSEQTGMTKQIQAPTGIKAIDAWTYGGLRSKQLGIIMAPTGEGKSAALMNFAYNMAIQDEWNVWFVTNELSLSEQTERLLSRISGVALPQIQHELGTVDTNFKQNWNKQMNARLRITSVNADLNTHELENMMMRWTALSGWKPQVLILDFMERMNPNDTGYERRAEWQWLGAVAKDLVRLARLHNLVLWTACQTNRSGMQSDIELNMQMAQSSTRHFQEASMVIGMRKAWGSEDEEALEIKPLKNRHGKYIRSSIGLKCNLETMYISEEEVKLVQRLDNPEEDEDDSQYKAKHTANRANPRSKN